MREALGRRWPACLYVALAALYLVPFWAVRYVPTTDGPSHLYNAWVLGQLIGGAPAPLLRDYFAVNPAPVPNWLSHATLAVLLRAMPPPAAEKTLLSAYVLMMAAALWCLAGAVDRRRAWLALLGLPFVWNQLLQFGFYNFCLSIPCFLLAIACWWRHRDRPGLRFAAALDALLLLCYFAHIVSAMLALAGIGVLWLASWRRERWRGHLAHLAIVAPGLILPLWFMVARAGGGQQPSPETSGTLWLQLAQLRALWPFAAEGGRTGRILGILFGAWIVFTLVREGIARRGDDPRPRWPREEDGFLALALLLAGIYFVSPDAAAGGSILKHRLQLYPFLAVIPWLSVRLGRWGKPAAILALAALAVRPVVYALPCYRAGSNQVRAFVRGLDAVPPGSVVAALIFDRRFVPCLRAGVVDHAVGYAAVAKGLIDWGDYEAMTDYFPLQFRREVGHPQIYTLEADPQSVRVRQLQSRVDYIYCWRLPPGSDVAERLARNCQLVAATGDWRLYSAEEPAGSR